MAGESTKTTVVLDLDNKAFVSKLRESLGLMGQLGDTDSLKDIASTFIKIGEVAGVGAVAILAVKGALDLATEAEQLNQINTSFDALAKSAGIAGDALKNELLANSKGLADQNEILLAANKGIVELGDNAKNLGQIMEIARKATVLFGGDLISNFERLNQALASGETRGLRQFGIIVDQTKALNDYAKSLGVGAAYLSDSGRKTAIMNAALAQAKDKFKDVDESTLATTESLKRASVAFTEIKDSAILAWDKIAGPTVKQNTQEFADSVHGWATQFKAWFSGGSDQVQAQNELLEINIKNYKNRLDQLKQSGAEAFNPGEVALYTNMLKKAEDQLAAINVQDEKSMQLAMHKAQGGAKPEVSAGPQNKVDYEKLKEDRLKFEKELDAIRLKRAEADLQYSTSAEEAQQAYNLRVIAEVKSADDQISELKKNGLEKGLITQAQFDEAAGNIHKQLNDKLLFMDKELQDARIKALQNYAENTDKSGKGIIASFQAQGLQAQQSMANMNTQGKVVFGALKNNAVSAFKAIGDGSKNAGDAMKGFMLGAIADIAESQGEFLLASGIGTFDPIQIAEGGVLIALASALRSAAGGSSSSVSGGGGGGGGGGATSSGPTAADQTKPEPAQQEKKAVTVSIMGNYFETDQTRTRLMDMIREAGDFTDFNLKTIGQK